ncbi:MAG: hypothetical protein WC455_27860 [Dehalococcoidia bacterium]
MSIIGDALDCLVSREWLRCWYCDTHGVIAVMKDGSETRLRLESSMGDGIRRVTFRLENGDVLTVVCHGKRFLTALYEAKVDWDEPMLEAWGAK